MVGCLLIAILAQKEPDSIGAFFPLNPGDSWVYSEVSEFGTAESTDTVGDPVQIGGETAFPVVTTASGKETGRVYYHLGAGQVTIVAFEEKRPLLTAYPILKSPVLGDSWTYKGETQFMGGLADMQLKGRVKKLGEKEFNGKKLEVLEVTLEQRIMEEFGTPITITQVATYGKGIGLLSMKSTSKLPKRTEKSSLQLVSYKPKGS